MKIRFELSEKEIRDMGIALKPMYEIDGLERYKADFDHDLNKIVGRICTDDIHTVVGHGYKGVVGNGAVRFEFDSRAVEMMALYVAKTIRRFNPLINSVIRFAKSMRELIGFTRETLRSDAEEFTSRFNRAFPVEREWKLICIEQAHAACLYERIVGSSDWTPIQWTTGWSKIEKVMDVMDVHPAYRFFSSEEDAKAAFHAYLLGDAQQKETENAPTQDDAQQDQTESSSDSDVNGWDYV